MIMFQGKILSRVLLYLKTLEYPPGVMGNYGKICYIATTA